MGAQALAELARQIEHLTDGSDRTALEQAMRDLPGLAERTLEVMRAGSWLRDA